MLQEAQYLIICKCCDMAKWMAQKKQNAFFFGRNEETPSRRNHRRMGVFVEPFVLCMSRYAYTVGGHGYPFPVRFQECGEHHLRGYHRDRDRCHGRTGVLLEFQPTKTIMSSRSPLSFMLVQQKSWIINDLSLFHPKRALFFSDLFFHKKSGGRWRSSTRITRSSCTTFGRGKRIASET